MESVTRTFVALSLALVVAAACGGREEDAAAPSANAPSGSAPAEQAAGQDIVDAEGKLNLTPEQGEKLRLLRESHIKKNGAKPKAPTFTRLESTDGSAIQLPDDFPADIPIFPGSKPTQHVSSATEGTMTVFETDETVDAARRHASASLTNEGWSITGENSMDGLSMLTAEKDGREISVAIVDDGGSTKITTLQN